MSGRAATLSIADGARQVDLAQRYEQMCLIRGFEEAVAEGYRDGLLEGLLHLSIGAEAVAVGIAGALEPADRLYSAHRPHGHFLAMGSEPRLVMAELAGRDSGLCRGRGGTMHLMGERAVMATGIVGGTLPLAVGHALHQPPGAVIVAVFGDGAVQTGVFHESMNLAALWRVPVLFVCENNGWAEFSKRDEHTTVGNVVRYGELYGIPARDVDGTDVDQVEAFWILDEPIAVVTGGATPVPAAPSLEDAFMVGVAEIVEAIRELAG